jgi:hypothetical protein
LPVVAPLRSDTIYIVDADLTGKSVIGGGWGLGIRSCDVEACEGVAEEIVFEPVQRGYMSTGKGVDHEIGELNVRPQV